MFKTIEEIKELEGMEVTEEQYEELECSEYVVNIENCGNSGRYENKVLYTVELTDGDEVQIYG